jgi:hypothetical protein
MFIYLYIYDLFNDAVCRSEYIASLGIPQAVAQLARIPHARISHPTLWSAKTNVCMYVCLHNRLQSEPKLDLINKCLYNFPAQN